MDNNFSIEEVFKNIIRKENEALYQRIISWLVNKDGLVHNSKPMVFEEACNYISCSASYLYKMTSQNLIPHAKRGKKLYFLKDELDAWLIENKVRTIKEIKLV